MIMKIRGDNKGRDEGFTLIELMVVVLIIAILIAIAIPTFLGARKRAQNRAAQSNLRNALTAEKTYYVDYQLYATDAQMIASNTENSLLWVNTNPPAIGTKEVGVTLGNVTGSPNGTIVNLTSYAASNCNFALKDIATGTNAGTYYYVNNTGGAAGDANDTGGTNTSNFPSC